MKPKPLHILAALLFTAAASFGQLSSPWNFTQDVARAESQQQPMQWFAAETLELNLWSRRISRAVDFSDPGLKLLWEVVAQTNVQTTWAATTGTVMSATNGAARYALNNQQANLPAGSYLGFVRAVWTNGTITSNVVLQYQAITVKTSANSGLYPVADPITQAYGITGAVLSIGGSVTQSGRTLYFNTPGVFTSLVRGAGSSDRLTVTNGGGAQAVLNLNVSGLATDNQWRADTERVGLVASNALAGLPSLAALTQGVVNVGLVASNALAGLPSLAGLSNAVLAVGVSATGANSRAAQAQVLGTNAYALAVTASNLAASAYAGLPSLAGLSNGVLAVGVVATNANTKAAQAQVLGTNAYALALLALTNLQESGSGNVFTGSLIVGRSGVLQRGTVTGSGADLAALSNGVVSVGLAATNAGNTAAQAQVLGTNAFALAVTASNLAASAFAGIPSLAALSNDVLGAWATASNALPLSGGVMTGPITGHTFSVTNAGMPALEIRGAKLFINNTNAPGDILFSDSSRELDMNDGDIDGINDMQVNSITKRLAGQYIEIASTLNGGGNAASNFVFYGDGSGLTNLPSSGGGAPQGPWTNTIDGAENVLTAAHIRARSLLVADGNSVGTGTTNVVGLVGSATFGNGSKWSVAAGQGANMGTGSYNFNAGLSNTLGGSYQTIAGGRASILGGVNYAFIGGGFQNNAQGTAATIGGGFYNTNSAGGYTVIGGGTYNRTAGDFATVGGGATNRALAIGSTIPGGGAMTVASTGDWSFAYNAAPTNAQTFGTKQAAFFNVPGGFTIQCGTGVFTFTESGLIVNGVAK